MTITATELLSDDMLARFDERAPMYDRENRFFDEDFDELRRSGYLLAAVRPSWGAAGWRWTATHGSCGAWRTWRRLPRWL